jgi:hypothetical protein
MRDDLSVPVSMPIPLSTGGASSQSFNQAFAEAHRTQGAGGTFMWQGNSYSTNRADGRDLRAEAACAAQPQRTPHPQAAVPPTTAPSASAPKAAVPPTTAPSASAPKAAVPPTTAPPTSAPKAAVPPTTAPPAPQAAVPPTGKGPAQEAEVYYVVDLKDADAIPRQFASVDLALEVGACMESK